MDTPRRCGVLEEKRFENQLYTVVCGYEWNVAQLLDTENKFVGNVIADDVSFTQAAHITRTLLEHGEPDMVYWMLPAGLYGKLVG
jgi:hypothetical protein